MVDSDLRNYSRLSFIENSNHFLEPPKEISPFPNFFEIRFWSRIFSKFWSRTIKHAMFFESACRDICIYLRIFCGQFFSYEIFRFFPNFFAFFRTFSKIIRREFLVDFDLRKSFSALFIRKCQLFLESPLMGILTKIRFRNRIFPKFWSGVINTLYFFNQLVKVYISEFFVDF